MVAWLYCILTGRSTHHSTTLPGDPQYGPRQNWREVLGQDLPCTAVLRLHAQPLVEELSRCFPVNTQQPKTVPSEGSSPRREGGTLLPPHPPPVRGSEDFMVRREAGFPFLC